METAFLLHFYKRVRGLSLLMILILSVSCSSDDSYVSNHSTPEKIADYFYKIEFTDYDWNFANNFIKHCDDAMIGGACTVIRNGDIVGRNLDTPYCEMCCSLVTVPATETRFASIGLSSFLVDITPSVLDKHPESKLIDAIPFAMTDGVNENGVFCAVNTLPVNDLKWKNGNNTDDEDLHFTFLVRYVLDNAESAKHAVELLSHRRLIMSECMREMHALIADESDTFIIEMIDGQMVVLTPKVNIMTNYYLALDHYTPHACGIERYELAKKYYDTCTDFDGMHHLLWMERYSNIYNRDNQPFWYSEFYLDHSMLFGKDITIDTPKEEYDADIDSEIELFKNRRRDKLLNLWFSSHSAVYNIKEKTVKISVQENFDDVYSFAL